MITAGPKTPRVLALATLAVASLVFAAPAAVSSSSLVAITLKGAPGLRIGETLAEARAHLAGPVKPGCELASPRPYFAQLRAPLVGSATFSGSSASSLLTSLSIRGGAVLHGTVKVGASAAQVKKAYPNAKVNNSNPPNPLVWKALTLSAGGKDQVWFMLTKGHVSSFELPTLQTCE